MKKIKDQDLVDRYVESACSLVKNEDKIGEMKGQSIELIMGMLRGGIHNRIVNEVNLMDNMFIDEAQKTDFIRRSVDKRTLDAFVAMMKEVVKYLKPDNI